MKTKILLALATTFSFFMPAQAQPQPSPVVVEFLNGNKASVAGARKVVPPEEAFFSGLKKVFPAENLVLLKEISTYPGLSRQTNDFLAYRNVRYRMVNKLPLSGEPLLILDGARLAKSERADVAAAISKLKKDQRQPMKLEAVRSKERIKVSVDVVFREHFSEGTRILLLVMESAPVPTPVLQIVDSGYLAPGHRGPQEQVLKLDRSWFDGRSAMPLRVVALLQREGDQEILSAAQTEVVVKPYALF